jgi:hypothetical protein
VIELTRTNGQRPVDRLSDIDKHIHVWETFVGGEVDGIPDRSHPGEAELGGWRARNLMAMPPVPERGSIKYSFCSRYPYLNG